MTERSERTPDRAGETEDCVFPGVTLRERSIPGTTLVKVIADENLLPVFKGEVGDGWRDGPNNKSNLEYEKASGSGGSSPCRRNGITLRQEVADGIATVEVEISDELVPFFEGRARFGWQDEGVPEKRSLWYEVDDGGDYTSADTDSIC